MTNLPVTPQQLLEQGATNVWCVNQTDTVSINEQRMRRALLIIVPLPDGNRATLDIPATFLAINLSDSAPAKFILNSPQFLKAYSEGLLRLVTQEEAAKINNSAGAESERRRLMQEKSSVREATRQSWRDSVSITDGNKIVSGTDLSNIEVHHRSGPRGAVDNKLPASNVSQVDMSNLNDSEEEQAEEVSAAFRGFASQLRILPEPEAINKLRARGTVTRPEGEHLASVLPASDFPTIHKFLKKSFG